MAKKKDDLMKLLMEDEMSDSPMGEMETTAKMDVLKELMEMAKSTAGDSILGDMDALQKVTVASPSKKGLMEGLEKAEEALEMMPEMEESEEDDQDEEESEMSAQDEVMAKMMPKEEESEEEDEEEEDMSGLSIAEMKRRMREKMMAK